MKKIDEARSNVSESRVCINPSRWKYLLVTADAGEISRRLWENETWLYGHWRNTRDETFNGAQACSEQKIIHTAVKRNVEKCQHRNRYAQLLMLTFLWNRTVLTMVNTINQMKLLDVQDIAHALSTQKQLSNERYKEEYAKEVQGKAPQDTTMAYPEYNHHREVGKVTSQVNNTHHHMYVTMTYLFHGRMKRVHIPRSSWWIHYQ